MKQTAVEWLVEKHFGCIDNCTPDFRYHIKQAKEMEKQQIIDAFNLGQQEEAKQPFWTKGNEYYEKNF
jgi:hypothetical protein